MTEVEHIAADSVDSILFQWYVDTARLRQVAFAVQRLAGEFSPSRGADLKSRLPRVVGEFLDLAARVNRAHFEALRHETIELYNRGFDVLLPDNGPFTEASSFVRRLPEGQAEAEASRRVRQARHVAAYEIHIAESIRHFERACSAMIDGVRMGDLDIIDDEFPKLAETAAEVRKAYKIWTTINGRIPIQVEWFDA